MPLFNSSESKKRTKPNEASQDEHGRYLHSFKRGDHIVRWTRLVVYPIQVHGIVLSASDDVVTICDFGLTAAGKIKDETSNKNDDEARIDTNNMNSTQTISNEEADDKNNNSNSSLEEMINHVDKSMMESCEKHRHKIMGPDRMNILVLAEEKDIKQWRKIDYGPEEEEEGKDSDKGCAGVGMFRWFKRNNKNIIDSDKYEDIDMSTEQELITNKKETEEKQQRSGEETIETLQNGQILQSGHEIKDDTKCNDTSMGENKGDEDDEDARNQTQNKASSSPSSPRLLSSRSDPTNIVIARVHFLINNPHVLPPHNIFFSNSECIAVWCKTGTWSTFQASIYLHSTAAGNFKTAFLTASAVGGSTVTTTVPASGIAGWFGMSTTATVSLVSVQPWLIPLVAGYGLLAVGTPYLFLWKCHERWKQTTSELNDRFWGELNADVYVDAIKCWSGLE